MLGLLKFYLVILKFPFVLLSQSIKELITRFPSSLLFFRFGIAKLISFSAFPNKKILFFFPSILFLSSLIFYSLSGCKYTNLISKYPNHFIKKVNFFCLAYSSILSRTYSRNGTAKINIDFNSASLFIKFFTKKT